jgi:3-hydroxyisobutyrate dehydrogenase
MTPVSVIGLGAMGLGMAKTLAAKGFPVIGFDISAERRVLAAALGVQPVDDVRLALAAGEIVVTSLPTGAHVAEVVEGEGGFLASAKPGAVIVDTSTSEPGTSRRLSALCAQKGLGFLDAPVSGGPAGANAGALTFMIGGSHADLGKARHVVEAMAGKLLHVGPSGAGNVAKLVNNLLVAAHLLTVSEAMKLSEAAGVPVADVLAVVNAASGRSAVSEVNYPRWILPGGFDSGFTMGLMRKDVRLAAALGDEVETFGPVSRLVAEQWAQSAEALADGEDFNRIVTLGDN